MPAGMTVFNDNGKFQIDELTYSLAVLATGTYNSLPGGVINTTIPDPMFAVYIPQDSGYIGGIGNVSRSGSVWSAKIELFAPQFSFPSPANIKWFVLGRPTQSASGAGLEVYDAFGNLKYSSAWRTKTINGVAGSVINPAKQYAVVGGEIGNVGPNHLLAAELDPHETGSAQFQPQAHGWLGHGLAVFAGKAG